MSSTRFSKIEIAIIDNPIILPPEVSVRDAIAQVVADNSSATLEWGGDDVERGFSVSRGSERSCCVLVVEEHRAIGIVTERDLMAAVLRAEAPDTIALREVMSPASLTWHRADINQQADLRAIWQQMRQQGVTIVPVLDDRDQPIGIISETSLLYALQGDALHEPSDVGGESALREYRSVDEVDERGESNATEAIDPPDRAVPDAIATSATIATWREHAARYRALFEDAHDAILIANLDGYITDVNYQAEIMFGYSRQELIGLHQSELHPPEDFDNTSAGFREVLQEKIKTAKNIRILCKNKQIKYVDIRSKMIQLGDRPIIQGIFHEVTQQSRIEETLRVLTKQTEDKQGEQFFLALVQAIAQALSVDYVFLVELTDENLTTLAIYSQGKLQSNMTYSPENSPCECVLKHGSFICKSGLQQRFPSDQHLFRMAAESYVGIALLDQKGEAIGNLFVINKKPMENTQYILSILGVFAARAAAELERQRANKQLEKLNQDLEETLVKQTQELREREHFLNTLLNLEDFPISIFWKDRNSVYFGCNRAFLRDANLNSLDEVIGKNDYEMPWRLTDADKYRLDDREVIDSNCPKLGIIETQARADGRQIWVETNKIPFHDLDGNVTGVLGLYQDITDRQQAEYELQHISTRLNLAVQSAQIGIWEWNISTNVLIWDEQMFALYGMEKSPMICNAYEVWLSCIHPGDTEQTNKATQQALAGQADYDIEFRIVRPDGEIRLLQANAIVQRDAEGQPICMIGVNYDITDLKRTEQQLRQKLETINAAVESIAIIQDDRFTLINPAHIKLFGYDQADELLGKSWKILYEPDEIARFEQDILPVLMRDRVWQGEAIGRRKDGSTFTQGLSLTLSEENALICMCRDITARKQAEQQLRDAKETAEVADRAKSNFLALMSHEIRTPINGVIGLAYLMQQTQLDDQQQEYLTNLSYSAQSLSQIVNDILDFSKVEAEKLSLDTIKFELDEVLARLKAVLALKASEKHLDLQFEIGETVPRSLVGDPLRLGQVAINLVSNAIKFTDRGSVTICIEERDRNDTITRLRFTVRDTGIGLTPAQIKTLFEPFTQVDPSASRLQGGTGLGLTICQKLVELMGGSIEVQSELGKGSAFFFELTFAYDAANDQLQQSQLQQNQLQPSQLQQSLDLNEQCGYRENTGHTHAVNSSTTHPKEERSGEPSSIDLRPMKYPPAYSVLKDASVLLVEDNDVNQLVARKVLEQFGMKVELAVNGRKAIAQVLHHHYDLILMDIRMPEMDGLEATRQIRRLSRLGNIQTQYLKTVPIIAMTAHAFKSDQQRSLEAGMNDHLSKPIDPEILCKTLVDWLKKSRDSDPSPSPSPSFTRSVSPQATLTPIASPTPTPSPTSQTILSNPSLTMLPGLDVAEGLARVYDDIQLYQDLLKLFDEIYQPFASDLRTAFQQCEYGQVIHLIHTLKGAAANVSAMAVMTQSEQVLQMLRTQTDGRPTLQFESDEIVELLRSLDLTLSSIAHAADVLAAGFDPSI